MTPYYERGGIVIYHADCRELLPTLAAGSVDLVLTDPPYGEVNRGSSGLRQFDKGVADIVTVNPADLVAALLPFGKTYYIWCGTEQVSDYRRSFVEAGLTSRLCLWEKSNPSPINGEHLWLSSVECCVFARRDSAYFSEHCSSPVWRYPTRSVTTHPTEKPLRLFARLVLASCPVEGIVLDPFLGSGTTAVAAKMLGRRFIGCEIEERYVEIAARRLDQDPLPFTASPLTTPRPEPAQLTLDEVSS